MREWGRTITSKVIDSYSVRILEPRPNSLLAVLDEATKWKDREFIIFDERRITFRRFVAATARASQHLAHHGVRRGDVVLLNGANSPEFLVAFWAILRAGGVVALANAWWSADEVAASTAGLGLRAIIADGKRRALMDADPRFAAVDILPLEGFVSAFERPEAPGEFAYENQDEEAPAVLIFTSGTTGAPKAAILSHRALVAALHNIYNFRGQLPNELPLDGPQMNTFCCTPLFHVGGVLLQTQALLSGNRLVILRGRADGGRILDILEREQIHVLATVPTVLARILDHPSFDRHDVSSLRTVSAGGSMVKPELLARARARFPGAGGLATGSTYGMTESGGSVTMISGPDHVRKPTSAGRSFPTCELRIHEADGGGQGEILIRAPSTMSGYWGRPDDNLVDADGWIHTGDLGVIDEEGFVHVTGRSKEIIIRGGENIATSVIEDRLTEHPAVLEAAVVGLEHHELGEEVAAAVVLRPGAKVDSAELAKFVGDKLSYFQVPTRWWLRDEALPTNAVGKVSKPAVRQTWPATQ